MEKLYVLSVYSGRSVKGYYDFSAKTWVNDFSGNCVTSNKTFARAQFDYFKGRMRGIELKRYALLSDGWEDNNFV